MGNANCTSMERGKGKDDFDEDDSMIEKVDVAQDEEIFKVQPALFKVEEKLRKNIRVEGSSVTKIGESGWNVLVRIPIRQENQKIKLKVDHTNSDKSGLFIGVIGEGHSPSDIWANSAGIGNGPTGEHCQKDSTYEFAIDDANDRIGIHRNSSFLGFHSKKLSGFPKPRAIGIFMYYKDNKVTVIDSPSSAKKNTEKNDEYVPSESEIEQFISMGFQRSNITKCLIKANGNDTLTVKYLMQEIPISDTVQHSKSPPNTSNDKGLKDVLSFFHGMLPEKEIEKIYSETKGDPHETVKQILDRACKISKSKSKKPTWSMLGAGDSLGEVVPQKSPLNTTSFQENKEVKEEKEEEMGIEVTKKEREAIESLMRFGCDQLSASRALFLAKGDELKATQLLLDWKSSK